MPGGEPQRRARCELGRRFYQDELIEVRDGEGRVGYDIYNNPQATTTEDGTDFAAIRDGEISVTPSTSS